MIRLTIDNQEISVQAGSTILEAANSVGIEIPTMCYLKKCNPSTSCLICVVQQDGVEKLVPSCATLAGNGMKISTKSDRVKKTRRIALELLLSDHTGDCRGPCELTCPSGVDIPVMIRQIADGDNAGAIKTVKENMPLPGTVTRVCSSPCERGCRRGRIDQPVAICLLKRYVADIDLGCESPYVPQCKPSRGKKIAIIGAGAAGLSTAYFLQRAGIKCTVFEKNGHGGGRLRSDSGRCDVDDVLDKEITIIEKTGVELRTNIEIGKTILLSDLCKGFDAVVVAIGEIKANGNVFGLEVNDAKIVVKRDTLQTGIDGVFAVGGCIATDASAVRCCADGKLAAASIDQYISGEEISGLSRPFNSSMGRLSEEELKIFLDGAGESGRFQSDDADRGFTPDQAHAEAMRCLHCDCRKKDNCKLRDYAQLYHAKPSRYKSKRRRFVQDLAHCEIVYEPGKCILCGLCIQIAEFNVEALGLAFINRGFDVRVAVPFDASIAEALSGCAKECVNACPTGALAFK